MPDQFNVELFENDAHQNGMRYWLAHDFMVRLGYESWTSFQGVINKAMASCAALGIKLFDNFQPIGVTFQGKEIESFKLSRFACLLITMHADSRKEQVAQAKAALAAIADQLIQNALGNVNIERLEARQKLSTGERHMSEVAMGAGLLPEHFGIFKDAGFRGMYNMSLNELKDYKHTPDTKRTLYDFMGITELAANSFRTTQTAERIRTQNIRGLDNLNNAAAEVGREVRDMMIRNSGIAPENLALEQDINTMKKSLKGANKQMLKYDKPKKVK